MSNFEFYLAFYGLLLGLTAAQLLSGLAEGIERRHETRIGLLTPILAIFLLADITGFWMYAWQMRDEIAVDYKTVYAALLVSSVYYISAHLVFPPADRGLATLDEHYWANKRFVVIGVAIANVLPTWIMVHLALTDKMPIWIVEAALYYVFLALLFLSRRTWLDLTGFGVYLVLYLFEVLAQ